MRLANADKERSPIWSEKGYQYLWHYADKLNKNVNDLWNVTARRILMVDKEIEKLFTNDKLKRIFEEREVK